MKCFRILSILALVALMVGQTTPTRAVNAESPATSTASNASAVPEAQYIPGEVVVTFQNGLSATAYQSRASALAGQVGAAVANRYQNLALLSFDVDADVEALAAQIALEPGVSAAQPNYVYHLYDKESEMQADPYKAPAYQLESAKGDDQQLSWAQVAKMRTTVRRGSYTKTGTALPKELTTGDTWGWDFIQAEVIWDNTAASPDICLLDTGVDRLHPDLGATRVINGYDFINFDTVANDDNGHGTHLAGILMAANNNTSGSVLGVSNGKVLAVKVLNAEGRGSTYSVSAGLRFCAGKASVKVINLSLTGWWPDGYLYDSLDVAINNPPILTGNKPKLVVVGAGNWSNSGWSFPAAWSDRNVLKEPGDPNSVNDIYRGLISVAGGGAPDRTLWVDQNGDHN